MFNIDFCFDFFDFYFLCFLGLSVNMIVEMWRVSMPVFNNVTVLCSETYLWIHMKYTVATLSCPVFLCMYTNGHLNVIQNYGILCKDISDKWFLSTPSEFSHISSGILSVTQQEVVISGREGCVSVWDCLGLEERTDYLDFIPTGPDGAQGLPTGLSKPWHPLYKPCFGRFVLFGVKYR